MAQSARKLDTYLLMK